MSVVSADRFRFWVLAALGGMFLGNLAAIGLAAEPAQAAARGDSDSVKWKALFDGRSLDGWEIVQKYDFSRHGACCVERGRMVLEAGEPFTGLRYREEIPNVDYEIEFEAQRLGGSDFFLGAVFPVGKRPLSFVVGGWGGEVVGLTNVDGEPAVENQTCQYIEFENGRWYTIRLRVTEDRIGLWVDKKQVVDFEIEYSELTIRIDQEPLLPLGICTYNTAAAYRKIRVRELTAEEIAGR